MDPPPVEQKDLLKNLDQPYSAERVKFQGNVYDLIIINLSLVDLKIERSLNEKGLSLKNTHNSNVIFATNGGMFQENKSPLGYFSENGKMISPLNRSHGYGNFYMKPNGVFFVTDDKAQILETEEFSKYLESGNPIPDIATQSGPLLLHKGLIHRTFNTNSQNKFVRNAVGVINDRNNTIITFAISDRPVNFYDFSIFFKEVLHCTDALYLDGHISALYLPALNRNQNRKSLGTVIYAREP